LLFEEKEFMTKRFSSVAGMVLGVCVVFALVSCDDFFSTSWGKERDYDISKIKLTQNNLEKWKEKAVGNPKLAAALVEKIISELPGKSGAEKAAFQKAGVELAIEQAGIGTKIIEVAGSDLSSVDSESGVKNLLSKVQGGLPDVDAAAGNITAIVGGDVESGNTPAFNASYAAGADPSDVGMAVMVLTLSLVPGIESGTKLENSMNDLNLKIDDGEVKTNGDPSQEAKVLAAYLNLIATDTTGKYDNNLITGGIRDAFGLN
jgi:hypothetical protein